MGYFSADPSGDLAEVGKSIFGSTASRAVSGIGPSISYNARPGLGPVLFDAGVNLTVSALEAAYLPALSSLAAIPKGMINGATKKTIGTLIRTPAVVNASYKESPENIIPTSAEVVSGLKGLVHGAAMDITYNNAMANVLMLGETVMGGHASPVADAILHNINPIGELDPLLGQYTLDGYNADSVVNEPNETRSRSEWTFDRVVNTNRIARNAAARWKNTITSSV